MKKYSTLIISAVLAVASVYAERQQGPSNRTHELIVSEIMYHPKAANTNDAVALEYIEIFNACPVEMDLRGFRISGDVDFTFPTNDQLVKDNSIKIGGHSYLVIAADKNKFSTAHPGKTAAYEWDTAAGSGLPNDKGTVRLRNRRGDILYEVTYGDAAPWPKRADGLGHSLVLARPDLGEANPGAWEASHAGGGSPGEVDQPVNDGLSGLVINEVAPVLAAGGGMIELYNAGSIAANLSNCELLNSTWNDVAPQSFALSGTLGAGQFLQINIPAGNAFELPKEGSWLFIAVKNSKRVVNALQYRALKANESYGRLPDGGDRVGTLDSITAGASNNSQLWKREDILITEIMYDPLNGSQNEYIELYNRGTSSVDLSGWHVRGDISSTLPADTVLGAGDYLVVARDEAYMLSKYPSLNASDIVGDFDGKLDNTRGIVRLLEPAYTNASQTDVAYRLVDEVSYHDYWGQWSDGGGSSLELIDLESDNGLAVNWKGSDESFDANGNPKSAWTTIEVVGATNFYGKADYAMNASRDYVPRPYEKEVHLFLQDEGECLVDNVEVNINGGNNALPSPAGTFDYPRTANDPGATGVTYDGSQIVTSEYYWQIKGSHRRSFIRDTGGFGDNSRCLHLVADSEGNVGPNKVEHNLTQSYFDQSGSDFLEGSVSGASTETIIAKPRDTLITLRAKVRWLAGSQDFLMRLNAGYMEAYGKLEPVQNPGTPGALNSRDSGNAGPAITEVAHAPLLPQRGEDCVVTARLDDPNGVKTATLYAVPDADEPYDYSVSAYDAIPMKDDGTGGDAVAGDGIYSGILPQPPASNKSASNGTLSPDGVWNDPSNTDKNGVVRFYISTEDQQGNIREYPENHTEDRDALVLFDAITRPGAFNNLRILMTRYSRDELNGGGGFYSRKSDQRFETMSNAENNCTLIYNDSRVIHNAGIRYRGSAYKRPREYDKKLDENMAHSVKVKVPEGEKLLNSRTFNFDSMEFYSGFQHANDNSLQRERNAFWIADRLGLATLRPMYTTLIINGARSGQVHTDVQKMNKNYLRSRFPDDAKGDLHYCVDWFSYGEDRNTIDYNTKLRLNGKIGERLRHYVYVNGQGVQTLWHDMLLDYQIGNYRWQWVKKTNDPNDYDNLLEFLENINKSDFETQFKKYCNVDSWMGALALRLMTGDLDGFLMQHGKNGYVYKPEHGKWETFLWDLDHAMGNKGDLTYNPLDTGNVGTDLFIAKFGTPSLSSRWYDSFVGNLMNSHGEIRRAGLRYFWRAVAPNGPLQEGNYGYVFDQYHAAFNANGIFARTRHEAVSSDFEEVSIADYAAAMRTRINNYFSNPAYYDANLSFGITGHKIQYGVVTLSGSAPLDVYSIKVNGYDVPVQFTDDYSWQMRIVLAPGDNTLALQAYDIDGNLIQGMSDQLSGLNPNNGNAPAVPILHYDFEDTQPDAVDRSGNDYHGTFLGAATRSTQDPALGNKCLSLNGNLANCVVVPEIYESAFDVVDSSFAGSLWMNADEWPSDDRDTMAIMSKGDSGSWRLIRDAKKAKIKFQISGSTGNEIIYSNQLEANTWYHVVFSYDADLKIMSLYMNGSLVSSAPFTKGTVKENGKAVSVGAENKSSLFQRNFIGRMDDVQFFTNALDQIEVNNLYAGRAANDFGADGIPAALPGPLTGKLRISEIMYNPTADPLYPEYDASDYEYLEIYNATNHAITLAGARFSSGIDYDFEDDFLGAGKYAVLVRNEAAFRARYGSQARILGQYEGGLSNSGEKIAIKDITTNIICSVTYGDALPWPLEADGGGSSIGQLNPQNDGSLDTHWAAEVVHGTPGLPFLAPQNFADIQITEVITHTDAPQTDAIELHNAGSTSADVGGWYLTDKKNDPTAYMIPAGSSIPAGGYLVIQEDNDGNTNSVPSASYFGGSFRLSSHGESVYLFAPDVSGNTYLIDECSFKASANGVSFGRHEVSTGAIYYPAQSSLSLGSSFPSLNTPIYAGSANAGPQVGPLVITEILPAPVMGYHEFVEIKNISSSTVYLYDNSTGASGNAANTYEVEGINFAFAGGLSMAAGETILLVSNSTTEPAFRALYSLDPTVRVYLFNGDLSNTGERIAIVRPDAEDVDPLTLKTIVPKITVDEVRYETIAPWPAVTGGYSLQRSSETSYGNEPNNWVVSTQVGGEPSNSTTPVDPVNQDSDGDGVNDFLEVAFATDIYLPDAHPFVTTDSSGNMRYTVRNLKDNYTYTIQRAPDLSGPWTQHQKLFGNSNGQPSVIAIDKSLIGPTGKLFFRLQVSN